LVLANQQYQSGEKAATLRQLMASHIARLSAFLARFGEPFSFQAHGNHHRYGSLLNQPDGPAHFIHTAPR